MITNRLEQFELNLSNKPYCTDLLQSGIYPRPKKTAIKKRYLQPNKPLSQQYLIFDLDYPGSLEHIRNNNLPAPNFAVFNKLNGHSHLFYELRAQVLKFEAARRKPIEFLAKIEDKLANLLKADSGYVGLISKNPLHQDWATIELKKDNWELNDFLEYFELPKKLSEKSENRGLGRNVALFDKTRFWAYANVQEFRTNSNFELFQEAVYRKTEENNRLFEIPLLISEVKATAKSIAKWTWKNYGKPSQAWIDATHTAEKQAIRGKLSGKARYMKTFENRLAAKLMAAIDMKQDEIADFWNVNQSTISRWI